MRQTGFRRHNCNISLNTGRCDIACYAHGSNLEGHSSRSLTQLNGSLSVHPVQLLKMFSQNCSDYWVTLRQFLAVSHCTSRTSTTSAPPSQRPPFFLRAHVFLHRVFSRQRTWVELGKNCWVQQGNAKVGRRKTRVGLQSWTWIKTKAWKPIL